MDNLPTTINWDSELRGAAMLVKSRLVPKDIGTPEAALFCILAGRDLGLSAVQSLRSIRPIQGKIEVSADIQLALFHRDGGKSRWVKLDHTGAELELSASWLIAPHISKFGVENAKRAELMGSANYRKYPQAMFRSRAITQGLKNIGFLMGAGVYAPGELGGAVVVDQSGEVLPANEGEETQPAQRISDASGLSGVVEALPDDEREELANHAQTISDAVRNGSIESAMNDWRSLDNDQKTAVWAMMDKEIRKAIKAADAASRAASPPTIAEVSKLIMKGDLDAAADLASSFPDADRAVLEAQISERKAKASKEVV